MNRAYQFPVDARRKLRAAIAENHERMHGLQALSNIERGCLLLADYARVLQSLFIYHSSVAAVADRHGLAHLSSSGRRLKLLALDLLSVGTVKPGRHIPAEDVSGAALHGFLYVAEGSMLGGKVIAGQLDYLFGSSPDGRRFFAGTDEDRRSWPRLLVALQREYEDHGGLHEMICGARDSFRLFERCIEGKP